MLPKNVFDELYNIAHKVEVLYGGIKPMISLTDYKLKMYNSATTCYLCKKSFPSVNGKVRDLDHLTGLYRGPACNACYINYKLPRFIPIVLHNLIGYDSHFIVPQLGRDEGNIDVLVTNMEKFKFFETGW